MVGIVSAATVSWVYGEKKKGTNYIAIWGHHKQEKQG